jgi:FixJ family two-component response regulator
MVVVVDDDADMRDALSELMLSVGLESASYASTAELMSAGLPDRPGCLILDVRMPGVSGLDLQRQLALSGNTKPIVFLTAFGDVPMSVQAMRAGAVNFFMKPVRDQALLDAVSVAVALDQERRGQAAGIRDCVARASRLTQRERQVFREVAAGRLNKEIAFELGISLVTVKLHRGQVMRKMRARSIGELLRLWQILPRDMFPPRP